MHAQPTDEHWWQNRNIRLKTILLHLQQQQNPATHALQHTDQKHSHWTDKRAEVTNGDLWSWSAGGMDCVDLGYMSVTNGYKTQNNIT